MQLTQVLGFDRYDKVRELRLNRPQTFKRTVYLSMLLGGFLVVTQSPITLAQNAWLVSEKLPSPPAINSISNSQTQISSSPIFPRNRVREYIFKKPNIPSTSSDREACKNCNRPTSISTNRTYLVEVYGDSDLILYQVKKIEPQAFRKQRFIQVGKFRQQKSADAIVQKLNRSGLRSRVTVVSAS
jgi:hypothetical protein